MEQKYCKHCGSMLEGESIICRKCGFDGSTDNKYCGNCGTKVEPEQVLCVNCNHMLRSVEKVEKTDETDTFDVSYKKFCPDMAAINRLSVIDGLISVLIMICVLFLPIYTCKYQPELDEIKNFDQFSEALNNDGYITKNFSFCDNIQYIIKQHSSKSTNKLATSERYSTWDIIVFVGCCVLFFILDIINLITCVLKDNDRATMSKYNEVRQSGILSQRINFAGTATFSSSLSIIVFVVIHIVMGLDKEEGLMCHLSGVSPYITVIVGCFICGAIISALYVKKTNSVTNNMIDEIIKEKKSCD